MAIAYVGGATNTTGSGTATTLTITYTSTGGNALVLPFLSFLGTTNITSVTDSASNAWTITGGSANTSGSSFLAFTTSNAPSAITSVTIHATTATNICGVVGEYSGVTTTNIANHITTSAATPSSTGAVTITTGNWLMAHLSAQTLTLPVFSTSSGTLRNSATMTLSAAYGFAGVALVDNTTGTSVTDAATFTGTYLTALAVSEEIH